MCPAFVRTFLEPHKSVVTKRVMVIPFLLLLVCAFFLVAGVVVLFAFRILSNLKYLMQLNSESDFDV